MWGNEDDLAGTQRPEDFLNGPIKVETFWTITGPKQDVSDFLTYFGSALSDMQLKSGKTKNP